MAKFILPPTPNWNLSNVMACSDDGVLAYGCRGELSILHPKDNGAFDASFIEAAHKDKLNVVTFSPSSGKFKNCLATCGDDGFVRVWDFLKKCGLYFHSGHKDGLKVTGMDWSHADPNRIVSVNDLGSIVCWDLASNTIRKLHCGAKVLPLCLSCCPHDKDIIAIGCKGGVTLVIDIKGSGKIIHRLRGQEQDITSLSWCPVAYNVFKHKKESKSTDGGGDNNDASVKTEVEKKRELMLATGGLDRNIFIWRAGSDGRYEQVINLPQVSISSINPRKKIVYGSTATMTWISVKWVDAYTLLSTSLFAELLAWDINKISADRSKKLQPRLLHSLHNKGCFSIACPALYNVAEDWKAEKRLVWTTAMDKHVVACSLASGNVATDIATIGGGVFSMALSPLDPNRLAIGSSDSKVFVWNTSNLSGINITTYWKKIIGRVHTVCWHPTEENLLAYGTSDGHIGILDLGSAKPPTLLRLYHRKAVYRLCWAPPLIKAGVPDDSLVLFSCADGDIFQYTANLQKPDEDPQSLNAVCLDGFDATQKLDKTLTRSDFALKPDLSCFAVGNDNGSVYLVDFKTLALKHTVYPHKKLMNNLEWHPQTVASDNNLSPYRDWLAISCDNIKVYNFPSDGQPELVATLNGHSMKIVSLAWSPHYNGRLVSASYDYTVQLWDVVGQSCLGVYESHNMAVMSALFSAEDPDTVISGSADNTVRFWSTSQLNAPSSKPDKKKTRQDILRKRQANMKEATELTVDSTVKKSPKEKLPNGSQDTSLNSSLNSTTGEPRGVEEYKKRLKNRGMFSITGPKLTQAKHFLTLYQRWMASSSSSTSGSSPPPPATSSVPPSTDTAPSLSPSLSPDHSLVAEEEETPSVSDLGYLDFFGDDKAMCRLLMVEENQLIETRHYSQAQTASLWRGDVTKMIQEAITKKQLSDWLVSIAPMAGFELWEQACEVYSAQLAEAGDVTKAASYLLVVHKTRDAVTLLADHKLYREAIAVAKCRLPADDPLTTLVYTTWANEVKYNGNSLLAAHCFLASGDIQACIEVLARIKELKYLKLAALMADKAGKTELAESLTLDCLTMSILAGKPAVGYELITENPQYQYWSAWLKASECLAKVKSRNEVELFQWLEGKKPGVLSILDELSAVCTSAGEVYKKLLPHLPTNKTPEHERDMWYYVSSELAAASAAKLEATQAVFLRHLVLALSAAYHHQTVNCQSLALPFTLSLITPSGLFSKDCILWGSYESEEEKQLVSSLRGFAAGSILLWMINNWEKVEKLLSKTKCEESQQVNGSGDSSDKTNEFELKWLPELLSRCSSDLLDSKNVSFFVKKSQRQEIQDVVAKKQIQMKVSDMKNTSGNKAETKNSRVKTDSKPSKTNGEVKSTIEVNSDSKKVDENLNVTVANGSKQSEASSGLSKDQTKTDEAIEPNGSTSFKEEKSQSKNETKDEKTPASSLNGSTTENENTAGNDENLNSKLKEIKELDEVLQEFEAKRVAVANPFTAYMNMKFLIEKVVSKQDSKLATTLQENCDQLWSKSHNQ